MNEKAQCPEKSSIPAPNRQHKGGCADAPFSIKPRLRMPSRKLDAGKPGVARLWFLPLLSVAACSLPPVATWHKPPPSTSRVEIGTASWYGPGFHGNRTSSGEVYDQHALTAAHQTLPLGSRIMVTNLENGKSVELRVNDRGPFTRGRIIDLSYAGARALDLVGPGTGQVRIETLAENDGFTRVVAYAVQAGAFRDGSKAMALKESLAARFSEVYLSPLQTSHSLYFRVRVGPFSRREEALRQARLMARRGVLPIVVEEVVRQ